MKGKMRTTILGASVNNKACFFAQNLIQLLQRGTALSRHVMEILQLHLLPFIKEQSMFMRVN